MIHSKSRIENNSKTNLNSSYCNGKIFVQLHESMVRVYLEYAHAVWYPINKNDRYHLEKVQWQATKVVPGIRDLYEERLKNLNLPNLVYRRSVDIIQVYKILHELKDISENSLHKLASEGITRGHSQKLKEPRHRTAFRHHSFSLSHKRFEQTTPKSCDCTNSKRI